MLRGGGEKKGVEGDLSNEKLYTVFPSDFSILALVSTEKDLKEGFLVFKRKNGGLGKRETDSSVFRDWKGGLVLGTLPITMIMKAGNTIYNHVSSKLSWRFLYSQHGAEKENDVTLHARRFFPICTF